MKSNRPDRSRTHDTLAAIGDAAVGFQIGAVKFFSEANDLRKDRKRFKKSRAKLAKLEMKVAREEQKTELKRRLRLANRRRHADLLDHVRQEIRQLDI
ncbi:MAG: hypothetical protein Q3962_04530 [Corynebacterium sp.]|nr:hypothetical protein [Corynebacterium sp.]